MAAGLPPAGAPPPLAPVGRPPRHRHYREVETEAAIDADADGIPDVYEHDRKS